MRIKYLPQDNEARINNGICRYEGVPYLISLMSNTQLQLAPLYAKTGREPFLVNINDQKIDISSPPLGWVNGKSSAFYLMRRPERNYKQSLRIQHLSGYNHHGSSIPNDWIHTAIFSKNGEDMFTDTYPLYKEATGRLSPGTKTTSVALSRNVCLGRDQEKPDKINVYYKLELVGELDVLNNTVRIPKAELAWIASKYLEGFNWVIE